MSVTDVARWQFGITTLYHYIFVPLTLGLSIVVASMETWYVRTKNPAWLRMTQFWGRLLIINILMGVVTGIVQEFQFGMNWSVYSSYVGDVFGAPLAMEALIAFFLESTFIGVWIFSWDRLSPRLHVTTIWLTAIASWLSAVFILAANSWMQNPVGYGINSAGRAQLTNIWAVLTNKVFLFSFPHTIMAAFLTAGAVMLAVGVWHLHRRTDDAIFRPVAVIGVALTLLGAATVGLSGHVLAQVMTQEQPMKMAAAEAIWHSENGASLSLFAIPNVTTGENVVDIAVPHILSILDSYNWNGHVDGIDNLQAEYTAEYGPGNYEPNVWVAFWSFRIMVGVSLLSGLIGTVALVLWRRRSLGDYRWFVRVCLGAIALPFIANFAGWILTEMGRQPWVVFGLLKTSTAVSPSLDIVSAWITLIGFTLLYGGLAVVTGRLMLREARTVGGPMGTHGDVDGDKLSTAPAY
jgi:cytochrome d ubiquinol oxidase subunit I